MLIAGKNIKEPANEGDAGFDLISPRSFELKPGERKLVNIYVHWQPPTINVLARTILRWMFNAEPQYLMRIESRSGMAHKSGIVILGGIVDASYRGSIGVIMLSTNQRDTILVFEGDKIAQAVFTLTLVPKIIRVSNDEELIATSRGTGGFGSTGR